MQLLRALKLLNQDTEDDKCKKDRPYLIRQLILLGIVEKLYERGLGRGEASSIVIAQAEGYDLLIDDKQAKKIATARGVKIISTAEIIMLNIQLGNIMLKEIDGFIEQWQAISEFPNST